VSRFEKSVSAVTVHWPAIASYGDDDAAPFLQERGMVAAIRRLADDFTFLNPHLTLIVDCFGEVTRVEATDAGWSKWKPSSPTSPHWYEVEHLERLLGAYITHDRQNGGNERTVREFISEFRGLSSTIKQKKLLTELGLARAPLSSLIDGRDFDHAAVGRLLAAMRNEAKPVRAKILGELGRSHVAARFEALSIRDRSFEYNRVASLGDDGLPQVTEVGFAALDDEQRLRRLVTGINWSASWVNPFRVLGGYGSSLDTMLSDRRFEMHRPVALLVHVAHPRVQYADRGKSTVVTR
jgi:hypothetical protein